MSRSKPEVNLENPSKRFFEWSGDDGVLRYYDKETKLRVEVPFPFRFLVLDDVVTVGGGIKPRNGEYIGYWSNAIRQKNLETGVFIVKSKQKDKITTEGEGTWAQIKGDLNGSKFVKGLYVAFKDGEDLQIGYLKLKGSSFSAWLDFNKENGLKDICAGAYTLKERSEMKVNGKTEYYEPVFTWTDQVTEETEQAAIQLDKELQEYLDTYFALAVSSEVKATEHEAEVGDAYEEPPEIQLNEPENQSRIR